MILGYPVMGIWFWCTDQAIVQRTLGASSIRQGQTGCVFAGYLKITNPLILLLPGIICFVLHPNMEDPDKAFTVMMANYLPIGMLGLVVAGLIAAMISTIDSALNSLSTVFALDSYRRYVDPDVTGKRLALIGRLVTIAAAIASIFFALAIAAVEEMDLFSRLQSIISFLAPSMSAVFLVGVLWRRATSATAISTLLVGTSVSLSIGVCYLAKWLHETFWPHFLLLSLYLFVSLSLFMIIVSLLTKQPPAEKALPPLEFESGHSNTRIWFLWSILALIMLALYVIFN